MEEQGTGIYEHLQKLSRLKSESQVEHFLLTLWNTRKTGLSSPDKTHFLSLLNLSSLSQLDPVLVCLRSLMRKYLHENLDGDDLLKMFPPGLSIDLQNIIVSLFQKHQNQWRDDIASDKLRSLRGSATVSPPFKSLPSSQPLLQIQNDPNNSCFVGDIGAISAPLITDSNMLCQSFPSSFDDQSMLPRLKSMTWSMEKGKSVRANKVAVIILKLQDYSNSTLEEMEVKFQVTKETLEAMLRSLTYISEKLSSIDGSSSFPLQKKQRLTDHTV